MPEHYITTQQQLEELCDRLRGCPWLAVDTEFVREKTYFAQLCLVQVASDRDIACIDIPAVGDPGALLEILYDSTIMKVFHAASQDLEIFHDLRQEVPRPVFDTQVAAAVLGYGDQVSYAALVKAIVGVEIDKSHARTDWSRRPLTQEQLRYASDDVRYLVTIYHTMIEQLGAQGRADWPEEDIAALTDAARYANPPQEAWRRLRSARQLDGLQLAMLRELCAWREQRARELNRPRRWILGDDVLTTLARRMPASAAELKDVRGLPKSALQRDGDALLECIRRAGTLPADDWPSIGKRIRLNGEQESVVDTMMALVRRAGSRNRIAPASLTTRRDLERLVAGDRDIPVLHGWRGHIVGNDLLELLKGRLKLYIDADKLEISPTHG